VNNSGVGGDTIDRIGKSRIAVKYPEDQGGKYDVGIEVFHHMHCLVRKTNDIPLLSISTPY
jgi:hypothetical protein